MRVLNKWFVAVAASWAFCPYVAAAQVLPGPADAGRIRPSQPSPVTGKPPPVIKVPQIGAAQPAPAGADQVTFQLQKLTVEGVTAFSDADLADIYRDYEGREVSLDVLWLIAGRITERYRSEGYFLSRAFVPAQEVGDGRAVVSVVEGHVSQVVLADSPVPEGLLQEMIARLTQQKPLSSAALESFMLRLNDLPGAEFRAYVEPADSGGDGEVKLVLQPMDEAASLSLSVDNYGSRFLGPHQATAVYEDSLIANQQTSLSMLASLPTDELKYFGVNHAVPIAPDWELGLFGNYVSAHPGATLEPNDISINSVELEASVRWKPIRQRQENLTFALSFGGKNTNGDILGNNPLTRDRIRTARLRLDYDTSDRLNGYNALNATFSQGLGLLGASNKGDLNLSRAEAEPSFSALKLSYTRWQPLGSQWMAVAQLQGQYASDPLYSSEEFGYGGSSLGRAYDASEITGDHGIAAGLELQYQGFSPWKKAQFTPYGFYDVGRVWNKDVASKPVSAASAGLGVRTEYDDVLSSNLAAAWPLTKSIDKPTYARVENMRLLWQIKIKY